MTTAAWKNNGKKCGRCGTPLGMKDGKVKGAELDHIDPLSWVLQCPALQAESRAAREAMAQNVEVFMLLCTDCHNTKTAEDNMEAARAAATTLFFLLFGMSALPMWTPHVLVTLFPPKEMQERLRKMFEADLIANNESLKIYLLGENGMPMCRCRSCGKLTEVHQYTWSQNNRDGHIEKCERAVMLKPHCGTASCRKSTIPVVCEETVWPHFGTKSAQYLVAALSNSDVGWMLPVDDAQVARWREKFAKGLLWFRD
jgi:hypothetical protein